MELSDAGLQEQPFRAGGEPLAVSTYASHRNALEFLRATYGHRHGLGVLQGPTLSGKSTIIRKFMDSLGPDVSTAMVDGKDLTPVSLLKSILGQFGYSIELETLNELQGMLRVVSMQQTVSGQPPLLAVENCHHLDPDTLRTLCDIADIKANRQSAVRLVMACQRSVDRLINAPELQCIATRVTGIHRMQPMVLLETRDYLHEKLYAAGAAKPEDILPEDVCVDIHMTSGGWPGIADRLALFALASAEVLPVTRDLIERRQLPRELQEAADLLKPVDSETLSEADLPRLLVSCDGDLINDIELDRSRLLIGRSAHNDLTIDNRFVSRHHALLVSHGASTLLMDLNSTNGTYVNSRRVSNHVMRHDDVMTFGNTTVKFVHPLAERSFDMKDSGFAETVILKTLHDMRYMLTGESTRTMPIDAMRRLVAGDKD